MDWSDTLRITALSLVVIGVTLACGPLWIPYTEPIWRIASLGTMLVLTLQARKREASRRSDVLMVAVLALIVLLGSLAFGVF